MQTIKYFSIFSGIGGFELGIEQTFTDNRTGRLRQPMEQRVSPYGACTDTRHHPRATCVGFSEINPHAIKVYEEHFSCHQNYGDITQINEQELPGFDLLCGGFPCQAFSIAGQRAGFEDRRGAVFFDIARIIKQKQPRFLLLENVRGLLSHQNGETFLAMLKVFDELGYDVEWQVLNSKDFGVAQNRERVYIVGYLRGQARQQIFPFFGTSNKIPQRNRECRSFDFAEPDIRSLTPVECERLQGFPDGWTEGISTTQRYKCLGNAVTTYVVRDIISAMFG